MGGGFLWFFRLFADSIGMGCSFNYVLLWLWFVIRGLFVTTAIPEAKSSLYYGFHSTIPHVVDAVKINKSVDDKKTIEYFYLTYQIMAS